MGDLNQFGSPFSTQPSTVFNDYQNAATIQEQNQPPTSIFPSSGLVSFSNNAEASGAMRQEPAISQAPSLMFSNPGPKSLFGASSQNTESSTSIFAGSAFSKPSESVFAPTVRQSIFGGNSSVNKAQSLNLPKVDVSATANLFGRTQTNSGVNVPKAAEVVPSAAGNIFGSSFSSQTMEPTSTAKPSIFGGAYAKREEPSTKSGFSLATTDSDKAKVKFSPSETTKVSFDGLASGASDKPNLFSSPKSAFGRFSNTGIVTSTLSNRLQERPSNQFSVNDYNERKDEETYEDNLASNEASGWEPDSLEGLNQDHASDQPNNAPRMNKLARVKRGVFGKALADVAKTSSRMYSLF